MTQFNKTYSSIHKKLADAEIELKDFWLWVEKAYQEAFEKFNRACETISALCKSNTPADMERFKTAVQQEMQGLEFFIDKYIEAHKKLEEAA